MHIFRGSRLSKWKLWRIIILLNSVYHYFHLHNTRLYFVNIKVNFRQYNIYTIILFLRTQSVLHDEKYSKISLSLSSSGSFPFVCTFFVIFSSSSSPRSFHFFLSTSTLFYFLFFFRLLSTLYTFQSPWFSPFHDKIIKRDWIFSVNSP